MTARGRTWNAGERLVVRGEVWRVVEWSRYADCQSLRLSASRVTASPRSRIILLPFDRPRRVAPSAPAAVIRPRAWVHRLRRLAREASPAGGLSSIVSSGIALLAYQLEPALAMCRDGVPRIIIADDVGLGKTVQAGIVLNELSAAEAGLRALIVVPAGLREQWTRELAQRFGLRITAAGSSWLAATSAELPADVNPWTLPGIYVASLDFIKRPEALRPLEEIVWDLLIVDEAHESTTGTARRAAVHAVASRARRVVLLTATPHGGDRHQFEALCRIGADPASPPIVMFRRSRQEVGAHAGRRTIVMPVHLSGDERRMHRLLESYTARLYREARLRGDSQARLVAIVLRKRALSSAGSLADSCTRRLALLQGGDRTVPEVQLPLPLADEDPLGDCEPDSVLAAAGLADTSREHRWLAAIAAAARKAARRESKIALLLRLLRRVKEPVIVFTEYRDTLERVRRAIAPLVGEPAILHGGLDVRQRAAAQDGFNTTGSLLLATDAASEGLNLHVRCRTVVHYELPWSPARLEQRTGRVDRIGQPRTVHEILLVADDTAERVVLAPLVARAVRSRSVMRHASRLVDVITESRVASAVIEGKAVETDVGVAASVAFGDPPALLHAEAAAEAARLLQLRQWEAPCLQSRTRTCGGAAVLSGVTATAIRARRGTLPSGLIAVYLLSLATADGVPIHRELAVVRCALPSRQSRPTPADVRRTIAAFVELEDAPTRTALLDQSRERLRRVAERWRQASAAMAGRERTILSSIPSTAAHLVQAGLFEQRALRASAARSRTSALLQEESERRLEALSAPAPIAQSLELCAVLVVGGVGPR